MACKSDFQHRALLRSDWRKNKNNIVILSEVNLSLSQPQMKYRVSEKNVLATGKKLASQR